MIFIATLVSCRVYPGKKSNQNVTVTFAFRPVTALLSGVLLLHDLPHRVQKKLKMAHVPRAKKTITSSRLVCCQSGQQVDARGFTG